jgi:hypothetical protein
MPFSIQLGYHQIEQSASFFEFSFETVLFHMILIRNPEAV